MILRAATDISEFGASEIFILGIIVVVFSLGIYTLIKFRKNKNL